MFVPLLPTTYIYCAQSFSGHFWQGTFIAGNVFRSLTNAKQWEAGTPGYAFEDQIDVDIFKAYKTNRG